MCYTNGPRCSGSLASSISVLDQKLNKDDLGIGKPLEEPERADIVKQISELKDERYGTAQMQGILRRQAEKAKTKKERSEKLGYADYCADLYEQKKAEGKALTAVQRALEKKHRTKVTPMPAEDRKAIGAYLRSGDAVSIGQLGSSIHGLPGRADFYTEDGNEAQQIANRFVAQGNNHIIAQRLLSRMETRLNHVKSHGSWGDRGWNKSKISEWETQAAILKTSLYQRQDEKENNPEQYSLKYSDGVGYDSTTNFSNMQDAYSHMSKETVEHPGYDDTQHAVISRKGEEIASCGTNELFKYNGGFSHGYMFTGKE